jgi:hypothetical protein
MAGGACCCSWTSWGHGLDGRHFFGCLRLLGGCAHNGGCAVDVVQTSTTIVVLDVFSNGIHFPVSERKKEKQMKK